MTTEKSKPLYEADNHGKEDDPNLRYLLHRFGFHNGEQTKEKRGSQGEIDQTKRKFKITNPEMAQWTHVLKPGRKKGNIRKKVTDEERQTD